MALYLSTYTNKIDRKGRVSVPAPYRTNLADQRFQGIVVYPSLKLRTLDCASMDHMEELNRRIAALPDERREDAAAIFADAQELAWDGEGRIILPQHFIDHAGITDQASFVGLGSSFQIWEPERFQAYQQARRGRARDVEVPPAAALPRAL